MSPKTHSTLALTELIAVLNCRCSGVRCNPLNGGHHRCIKDCQRESDSKTVTVATSQNRVTYLCHDASFNWAKQVGHPSIRGNY